jgi:hypothetical protein
MPLARDGLYLLRIERLNGYHCTEINAARFQSLLT